MDIRERSQDQRGKLEELVEKIPGYKGYADRERRRDSDKLQRELLSARLHEAKRLVSGRIQELSRQGNLALLTPVNAIQQRLERLAGEILYADRGYSGFFDLLKIKEAELDRVYALDATLLEQGNALPELVKTDPTFAALNAALDELETGLKRRVALLKGMDQE